MERTPKIWAYFCISFSLILVTYLLYHQPFIELRADTSFVFERLAFQTGGWFKHSNAWSNASHLWRINPVLASIDSSLVRACAYLIFLACGSYLFYIKKTSLSTAWCLVWSIAVPIFYLAVSGFDLVALSVLAWAPWLIIFLQSKQRSVLYDFLTGLVFAGVASFDLNQFGILLLLLVYLLQITPSASTARYIGMVTSFAVTSLSIPTNFAQYLADAHVVANYGTTEGLFPYFGASPPFPFLDRNHLRSCSLLYAIGLLVLTLPGYCSAFRSKIQLYNWSILTGLAFCVLADSTFFSGQFSQLMPLASITRILPGISLVGFTPIIIGLVFLLVVYFWKDRNVYLLGLFAIFLVACAYPALHLHSPHSKIYSDLDNLSHAQQLALKDILYAPSYRVIQEYGLSRVLQGVRIEHLRFRSLKNMQVTFAASENQDQVAYVADKSDSSRWNSAAVKDGSNSWFQFSFPKSRQLRAIDLDVGKFDTDFASSFQVWTSPNCQNKADEQLAFSTNDWQGALRFTDQGIPFFGKQQKVFLLFEQPTAACKLRIVRTAKNSSFDWSIAEISVAK